MCQIHTILPVGEHTHTIVFLHGRDSTAAEFAAELFESQVSDDRFLQTIFPGLKWVFPSSKLRYCLRFDTYLSQWFDMWSVENPQERSEIQLEALAESIADVAKIIRDEARELGSVQKVILAGISQGCATAIHALLSYEQPLGAFVGLCSWLPFEEDMRTANHEVPREMYESIRTKMNLTTAREDVSQSAFCTPVFISHCADDGVVPIANGHALVRGLRTLGMNVTWREYPDGGHWLNEPQGVDDLVQFLTSIGCT